MVRPDALPKQRFRMDSIPRTMPRDQPAAYKFHQALSICHGASIKWFVVRFRSFCRCCSHKPRSNARYGLMHCRNSDFGRFRFQKPCLEINLLPANFTRPFRYVKIPVSNGLLCASGRSADAAHINLAPIYGTA